MQEVYFPRQIESGSNALQKLGQIAVRFGIRHCLVVMDPYLASAPANIDERVAGILAENGITCTTFSAFTGEPTTDHVVAALNQRTVAPVDGVVAVGGGSAIDIGKAAAVMSAKEP